MNEAGYRLDGKSVPLPQKVLDVSLNFYIFFKYLSWSSCSAYIIAQITLPFFTAGWPLTLLTLTLCLSSALFVLIDLCHFYPLDTHKTAKINILYYGVSLLTLLSSTLLACTYLPIALIPTFLILPHLASIQAFLGLLVNLLPLGIILAFSMQLIGDILPPLPKTSAPKGLCHVALPTCYKRALARFHLQSIIISLHHLSDSMQMTSPKLTDFEIPEPYQKAIRDWYQYTDDAKLSVGMPQTTQTSSSTHALRQEDPINTLANLNADEHEASTAMAESILKIIIRPGKHTNNHQKFNQLNALTQNIFHKIFPDFCQKNQIERRMHRDSNTLKPHTADNTSAAQQRAEQAAAAAEARRNQQQKPAQPNTTEHFSANKRV